MNWRKIRPFILTILAALLVVFVTGIAVADSESDIKIIKMGTDVTVLEKQILTKAIAFGGSITVLNEGQITNDAIAIGGDVILKANAHVDGDAIAIGGQIIKAEGAMVGGSEVSMFGGARMLFERLGVFWTLYLTNAVFSILSLLIVFAFGVFLLLLLPGHIQTITNTMSQHPFKSGIWGLGGIIAVTLFIALFVGSVFGFLLIPIVNLAFAVAGLLGAIATGLWIGKKILPRRDAAWFKPFLVGMLILAVINLIPIAGGLIVLMLNLFGFGAVLLSRVGTVQPESIQKRFDQLEGTVGTSGT